jgi:hypothetical protein
MCGKMKIIFLQITKFDHLRIHTQKPSLFTTILDMAALEKTGSRAGSLSLENENVSSQTHLLYNHHQNGEVDHNSLATLARRSTMRKRSFR